jgi:hypothetical protein
VPLPILALSIAAGLLALRERGRRLSAQSGQDAGCPGNPPPFPHLKLLRGIAHPELQAWASSLVNDPAAHFGEYFEKLFDNKLVVARVEHHPWTTHGAEIVPGCFKGVTLYEVKSDAAAGADDGEEDPPEDTAFFPIGDGQWCAFPSGDIIENDDIPYERMDPSVATASGLVSWPGGQGTAECALHPWYFPPGFCKCVLAGGDEEGCMHSFAASGHGVGQSMMPAQMYAPRPRSYNDYPYMDAAVSRDEAFDAAQMLQSMYPGVRSVVAQAPDGFYVRVITSLGGGGGWGGGLGNLFGPKGLRQRREDNVWSAINRLPAQIGRVRVQIDRLVSPDFAVGGVAHDPVAEIAAQIEDGTYLPSHGDMARRCVFDCIGGCWSKQYDVQTETGPKRVTASFCGDGSFMRLQCPDTGEYRYFTRVTPPYPVGTVPHPNTDGPFSQSPVYASMRHSWALDTPATRMAWLLNTPADERPPGPWTIGDGLPPLEEHTLRSFELQRERLPGLQLMPHKALGVWVLADPYNREIQNDNPNGAVVPAEEARAAQDKLRSDLIERCRCVLGWMRGVGLGGAQEMCGPGSRRFYKLLLLVDGGSMSDEARQMVPTQVGRVPVEIMDIGSGPVPPHMEIVAP